MDINQARAMFGAMGEAKVSSGREDVAEGRYWVLMNSIANQQTRDFRPFTAIKTTIILPLCDGVGRTPDSEIFEGSPAGTHCEWAYFINDYFASNMKKLIVTALGITDEQLKEMESSMTKDQINAEFFEYMMAATGEQPNENTKQLEKIQDGIFDNTTVIEVNVKKSDPIPSGDDDDSKGKKKKPFTNVYPNRKVPLEEVAGKLEESQLGLYFGSVENFTALLEAELEATAAG